MTTTSAGDWATAGGLTIPAMYLTGTFHPAGGHQPAADDIGQSASTFLLAPVLAGAAPLTAFACLRHAGWQASRARSRF